MKLKIWATLALLLFASVIAPVGESKSSGIYNRTSGCSCHSNGNAVTVSMSGLPSTYTPGQTYSIGVSVTGSGGGGFNLGVDHGQLSTGIGTGGVKVDTALNQATHTHNSGMRTWGLQWTAPGAGTGTATFNVAGLGANSNGGTSGDSWDTAQYTVAENTPANQPPSAANVMLSPSPAYTLDTLTLTYDYQDDDNDPESGSIITWYKDTIEQSSLSGQSSISSTLTTRGEEWYAEVTPSDGKDEGDTQLSNTVSIINSPPTASNVMINPSEPNSADDLTLVYSTSDADQDSVSVSSVRWYVNDVREATFDDTLTISHIATRADDQWYAEIQFTDSYDLSSWYMTPPVTIESDNNPPVLESVSVESIEVNTTTDIAIENVFTDPDGDTITVVDVYWHKNDVNESQYDDMMTITSDMTTKGDTWKAVVRIFDGTSWSNTLESQVVTVINSAPEITMVEILPVEATQADTLSYEYTFTDVDGDSIDEVSESWVMWYSPEYVKGDPISLTLTVYDGEDWSSPFTVTKLLENAPPTVEFLTQGGNISAVEDLDIAFQSNDVEGEEVVVKIDWQKNGFLQGDYANLSLVPSTALSPLDLWTVTLTPYDGMDYGESVQATFTVVNALPVAVIEPQSTTGIIGIPFNFSASESSDIDSLITEFIWEVDQAVENTASAFSFTPTKETHMITLTVVDEFGGQGTATYTLSSTEAVMPTNLQISKFDRFVTITWEGEYASYQVLRDNVSIAEVFGNEFTDYPPVVGDYSYQVAPIIDGVAVNTNAPAQSISIEASSLNSDTSSDEGNTGLIISLSLILIGLFGVATMFIARGD